MHSCMFQHSYTVLYNPSKLNIYQYLYSGVYSGRSFNFFLLFCIKFQRVNFIFIIVCNGIVIFILEVLNQIKSYIARHMCMHTRCILCAAYVYAHTLYIVHATCDCSSFMRSSYKPEFFMLVILL